MYNIISSMYIVWNVRYILLFLSKPLFDESIRIIYSQSPPNSEWLVGVTLTTAVLVS